MKGTLPPTSDKTEPRFPAVEGIFDLWIGGAEPRTENAGRICQAAAMAMSRAERRAEREPRARREYGDQASAVLDVLELTELAWHDCYADITPPDDVIDDIFIAAQGDLAKLAAAARLAVHDFRDLRVTADEIRSR